MCPNSLIGANQKASVVVEFECKAKPIHELENASCSEHYTDT
jgi:hypothetical protein